MLTTPTTEKLRGLGLDAMAEGLCRQRESADVESLGFEDRLGLLLDLEQTTRENRRMQRRLRECHLRIAASLEDVEAAQSRGLDKSVLLGFGDSAWIRYHQGVIVTGATGTGKTFVACALAHSACRQGYSARYYRAARLAEELTMARAQGTWERVLLRLSRIDVLVLDDFAMAPLGAAAARDLLEVVDDRAERRSTVVASQFPVDNWHEALGDPTVADAIMDRLVHGAHRLELRGESQRRVRAAHRGAGT